jgi:hypothetical protein
VTLVDTASDSTPAHLVAGRGVLVPTVFQYHLTVFDQDGNVVDDFTTPPVSVHGSSGAHLPTMDCTFAQTESGTVPGVGEVTVLIQGTVSAFKRR